jgi:hypothetical protein
MSRPPPPHVPDAVFLLAVAIVVVAYLLAKN